MRDVFIIKMKEYPDMGILASVKFLDKEHPKIGEDIVYENTVYRITGVILSTSSEMIFKNSEANIFECRLERISH